MQARTRKAAGWTTGFRLLDVPELVLRTTLARATFDLKLLGAGVPLLSAYVFWKWRTAHARPNGAPGGAVPITPIDYLFLFVLAPLGHLFHPRGLSVDFTSASWIVLLAAGLGFGPIVIVKSLSFVPVAVELHEP